MVDQPVTGEAIIERIREQRGAVLDVHHVMGELDPAFLDLFDRIYTHTLGYEPVPSADALPAAYRELICACACAVVGAADATIARHLSRAFEFDLTERQAIEGFQAMLIPVGGLPVAAGVRAIMLLRAERDGQDGTAVGTELPAGT